MTVSRSGLSGQVSEQIFFPAKKQMVRKRYLICTANRPTEQDGKAYDSYRPVCLHKTIGGVPWVPNHCTGSDCSFYRKKIRIYCNIGARYRQQTLPLPVLKKFARRTRKARHNVYAYILRENHMTRYSDDGEPQGTGWRSRPECSAKTESHRCLLCGHPLFWRHSAGRRRFGTGVFPQCCTGSGSSTDSDKNFLSSSDI